MYGDIIPPKKKYHQEREQHIDHITEELHEVNKSIHFTPIHRSAYREPRNKKIPILLSVFALVVIGFGGYHKIFNGTTISVTPKTARFEIQQKIPLVLQSREKDALTYSLVYVPEGGVARDPFSTSVSTTSTVAEIPKEYVTMTATSTGDVLQVTLINATTEVVPLRVATRFDVNGVTYTLDEALNLIPTPKSKLETNGTTSSAYKVIGFKGTSSYDTVYAIPVNVKTTSVTSGNASSTIPPQDILALMPEEAIALQKSTIYDRLLDQSAVVVFDERTLEEFLDSTNVQMQEYFKVLKPFGASISYTISIIDYTLNTSPETGKPVSFSNLIFEITPSIDTELVPQQFAGFKKETMEKIQKQITEFVTLEASYTPFWSKSVAEIERIKVK